MSRKVNRATPTLSRAATLFSMLTRRSQRALISAKSGRDSRSEVSDMGLCITRADERRARQFRLVFADRGSDCSGQLSGAFVRRLLYYGRVSLVAFHVYSVLFLRFRGAPRSSNSYLFYGSPKPKLIPAGHSRFDRSTFSNVVSAPFLSPHQLSAADKTKSRPA